jgi:glutathione S-transferase
MPYSVFYRHRPYRMISYGVSPYAEMARWIMDRRGAEYREESHIPLLHFLPVRQTDELPGLVTPERLQANARAILDYWEARSPCRETLLPDVGPLLDRFYAKTGMAVRRWAYSYMLPGSAGRIVYDGPFPDRLVVEFDA